VLNFATEIAREAGSLLVQRLGSAKITNKGDINLVTEADIADAYRRAYAGSPFVRLTGSELPEIKHVAHTNFCDIGWRVNESRRQLVVVACIDNLVKGAAGQAVQNFNVAFGFDEALGLN